VSSINRDSTADIEYHFRILNISQKEVSLLQSSIGSAKCWIKNTSDSEKNNFGFLITEDVDFSMFFIQFESLKISKDSFGLFVSMTMYQDHDGLQMPQYVLDFYQKTGGQVDFSVVFVDDSDFDD